MPSTSQSQQRLFGAVEGGATFPLAKKIRSQMTRKQVRDFASTKHANLPDRIKSAKTTPARSFLSQPKTSMGHLYGSHVSAHPKAAPRVRRAT